MGSEILFSSFSFSSLASFALNSFENYQRFELLKNLRRTRTFGTFLRNQNVTDAAHWIHRPLQKFVDSLSAKYELSVHTALPSNSFSADKIRRGGALASLPRASRWMWPTWLRLLWQGLCAMRLRRPDRSRCRKGRLRQFSFPGNWLQRKKDG